VDYAELSFPYIEDESLREWISLRFILHGFENIVEEENILKIYISEALFKEAGIDEWLYSAKREDIPRYNTAILKDQNWNEVWEKNYEPVLIGGKCYVRAPFHKPRPDIPVEIIIEPKMSFGTAHHATTALMVECMLDLNWDGKTVLDMGCGTGILGILANKLGASAVTAIDNDERAYNNARENFSNNGLINVIIKLGDAGLLKRKGYNVILANIQRNVLINDMRLYAQALIEDGLLIMSGFYKGDLPAVIASAKAEGMEFTSAKDRNEWVAAKFTKPDK
jgi:ribosomal protein L11 methyltransferase